MTPPPMPASGTPHRDGLSRRGAWLALLVALLTVLGAGLAWWQTERAQAVLREQALLRAEQRAVQLANAVNAQVEILLVAIDVALQQLRREWTGDAARFDTLARTIVATLPAGAVSHVSVAAADGQIVYNSLGAQELVNVADREHFRVHLDGADSLHVGKAVMSRLAGRWTFIVNRPLLRDGRFAGSMNVSVSSAYIARRLGAVTLSERDVVALVHDDGSFLARSRDFERSMGLRLPVDRPFLVDRSATEGMFRVAGEVDGVARLFAWRRLPGHGIATVVGLAEVDALAPLAAGRERERLIAQALIALALLSGAVVAGLLWRSARGQRALERSERRYRTLLDSAPDAIYFNQGGRFTYVNPAALRLFGATDASELLGQPVFDRIHPDHHAAVQARIASLLDGRRVLPPLAERYLRLDGSEVDVEVTAAPYADDNERGLQVVVRDITERRQAERELQRLNDELEQRVVERTAALSAARDEADRANLAKSEFLSRMSHELRTPLNAILGFGQLLALDLKNNGQAAHVREILNAGQHLLTLINEVLDLARIEAGHLSISTETVALRPLITECLVLLRPQAQVRQLSMAAPAAEGDWHVRADRTRLKQVLLNLLSNAIKYNREGGWVRLRVEGQGEQWRLCVDDSGPGLDAAQQARLFVPFERLGAATTAVEGTGIGLALSRRLVESMQGTIGVHSQAGAGSSFWVQLPKALAQDGPEAPMAASPAAQARAATGGSALDVLCIEDNPANLRLIEGIVAMRPRWHLLSAASPTLGLELARAHHPRLILLDINLPEMDGWAVMRLLREDPATREIPVFAMSANAMRSDIERGKVAGFADYLTKPLDLARVLAVLDAHAR
ncbi:MAG: PAS domain S-box protein [Rubrivivax sp.]|nr:PAS domain S-box protein [Rubrivivax sp.]